MLGTYCYCYFYQHWSLHLLQYLVEGRRYSVVLKLTYTNLRIFNHFLVNIMIRILGRFYYSVSTSTTTHFGVRSKKRFFSSHGSASPTVVDIYIKYKSVDDLLCKLRPDKMTDPSEPERLLKDGVISAEMAQKFKEEIGHRIQSASIIYVNLSKTNPSIETAKFYQYFLFLVMLPTTVIVAINTYKTEKEHLEHLEKNPSPYIKMPYMRNRAKVCDHQHH